jgi:hypothetical protein
MFNFPSADTAAHLSHGSRSFDMLVFAANDAIMKVCKTAAEGVADIDYFGVEPDTHAKFHAFMWNNGYVGERKNVNNRAIYRIRWE